MPRRYASARDFEYDNTTQNYASFFNSMLNSFHDTRNGYNTFMSGTNNLYNVSENDWNSMYHSYNTGDYSNSSL